MFAVDPTSKWGKILNHVTDSVPQSIVDRCFRESAGKEMVTKHINRVNTVRAFGWGTENRETKLALEGEGEGQVGETIGRMFAIKGVQRETGEGTEDGWKGLGILVGGSGNRGVEDGSAVVVVNTSGETSKVGFFDKGWKG